MSIQAFMNSANKALMYGDWIPVVNVASGAGRVGLGAIQFKGGFLAAGFGGLGGATGLWKEGFSWMRLGTSQIDPGILNAFRGWLVFVVSWSTLTYKNLSKKRKAWDLALISTLWAAFDIARGSANWSYLTTLTDDATNFQNYLRPFDYIPFKGTLSGLGRIALGAGQLSGSFLLSVTSAVAAIPNKLFGTVTADAPGAWATFKYGLWTMKEGALNISRGGTALIPYLGGKALTFYETTRIPAWVR